MPRIVSSQGVHLTDDIVKIHDIFPSKVRVDKKLFTEEDDGDATRVVIMDVFDAAEGGEDEPPEPSHSADFDAPVSGELLQKALEEAGIPASTSCTTGVVATAP